MVFFISGLYELLTKSLKISKVPPRNLNEIQVKLTPLTWLEGDGLMLELSLMVSWLRRAGVSRLQQEGIPLNELLPVIFSHAMLRMRIDF
jgi:hypothetical protein